MNIVVVEIGVDQLQIVRQGKWCLKKRSRMPGALMELDSLTQKNVHPLHGCWT